MRAAMYSLPVNDSVATAQLLRELADQAERGEIVGCALATITRRRDIETTVVGLARRSIAVGHLAASRLTDNLLWFK